MIETKFWSPAKNAKTEPTNFNMPKKKPGKFIKCLAGISGVLLALIVVLGAVFYIAVYRPAFAVVKQLDIVKADVTAARDAVVKRDLVTLEKTLTKLDGDLKDLRVVRNSNFGWAETFGPTKDYFSDSEHFINAGLYGIDAAREGITLVKPFADAAGLKVTEDLPVEGVEEPEQKVSLLDAFTTWISVMPEVANNIDGVLAQLEKVGKELSYVDPQRYPEKIRGIELRSAIEKPQRILSQLKDYAPDIKQALTIIPGLLGVDTGEKRYMIIMQNDKELRATGGFWTNYATFKLNNGVLSSDFSSKDMYSIDITLDAIDAYYTFPKAPAAYNRYLKVERLYARDANISPDFPTSVDQFMVFYKLAMPINPTEIKPISGIFAIDTQVIREFMEITGPVTVNGTTYSSDNVVLELERIASLALREQAGRKKVLGDLMEAMLVNVFESDKNLWSKLIEKGVDLAVRKHVLGYSFDPQAQALLEKYNFAGRIIDPVQGDYSYVVSTNLGGDKTNWFVNKDVNNSVTKEGNRLLRTVTIKYTYPDPDGIYGDFIKRFRDWVRVYAPLGSEFVSVDGSEDGTMSDQERNKTYFTGYVELGPRESKEMVFKYYLPDGVVGADGVYNLYVQKQPGIEGDTYSVTANGKAEPITLKTDYTFSAKL